MAAGWAVDAEAACKGAAELGVVGGAAAVRVVASEVADSVAEVGVVG